MGKVMAREVTLVLLTGIFGWLAIPLLLSQPPAWPLLVIGIFLGLTFMPMNGIALMVGKRLPEVWRMWLGVFAWIFAFQANIQGVRFVSLSGAHLAPRTMLVELVPPVLGLLLPLLAAVRAPAGERGRAAAWSLFLYSLPMWVVRDVLARLVSQNLVLALMAMLGGTLYMFLHGVLRIFAPSAVDREDRTEPLLLRRAVPDAVVGLVEGTLHRRARPYATVGEGRFDDRAISVLCGPDEVEGAVDRLTAALGDRPFQVTPGQRVKGQVEVVIRPRD